LVLATGFLEGTAAPWWDAINRTARMAPGPRLRLERPARIELDLEGPGDRPRAAAALRRLFRTLPASQYDVVLGDLEQVAGCDLGATTFRDAFMTWEQARALAAQGFEIGAHTHTHPVLSQLVPGRDLAEEV